MYDLPDLGWGAISKDMATTKSRWKQIIFVFQTFLRTFARLKGIL